MISIGKFIVLFIPFFLSCSHAQLLWFTKVNYMSCEQLAAHAKDPTFTLNSLAGIRGLKKCPNFNFDLTTVSDLERKIYLQEMAEATQITTSSSGSTVAAEETVDSLKSQIRQEKKPIEKMALMKKLRQKHRSANNKPEAVKVLTEFYKFSQKSWNKEKKNQDLAQLYLEATAAYGRHIWSDNDAKKAQQILSTTAKSLKNGQGLSEVYFLLGRISEELDQFKEAIKYYDLILVELKNGPLKGINITREKILWSKAWAMYKMEDWQSALEGFQNLALETVDTSEKTRANFFSARCLTKLEKKDEAKKILESITQADFYSYYSLLAYDELGQKIPAFNSLKATAKFDFDKSMSFLTDKQKELFYALINHDEIDLAERAALTMTDKPEQLTVLGLELAARAQRFLPLFVAFAKLPVEQKQDIIAHRSELLFPRMYKSEVSEMASKTGLPQSLIYSIMRQESAFNINSRSSANACGLMQVIPPLAKQLARKYKLDYKSSADLFNPQMNIKLGSFELSEQVKKQNDQYALVAAAYNAGPSAVSRWLKTRWRPKFDIVDFIEEIPYDETRLYVKVVARNHLFYDRLESPSKEFNFPEKFIRKTDLIQTPVTQN